MSARLPGRKLHGLLWGLLASLALAVLVTARWLTPHPAGLGTHLALGLPPCGFLLAFELPCPTCGLTTAFAHLARFSLLEAVRANPMGVPLFGLTLASVPLFVRSALRGDSVRDVLVRLQPERWALGLVVALLATWCTRVFSLLTR